MIIPKKWISRQKKPLRQKVMRYLVQYGKLFELFLKQLPRFALQDLPGD